MIAAVIFLGFFGDALFKSGGVPQTLSLIFLGLVLKAAGVIPQNALNFLVPIQLHRPDDTLLRIPQRVSEVHTARYKWGADDCLDLLRATLCGCVAGAVAGMAWIRFSKLMKFSDYLYIATIGMS